jgi:carboxyl-terminal processing protease
MSSLSKRIVIILSLVVIAFVATGYLRARSNDEKAYRALTVYSEVLDKVQNDYVDDPNMAQVTSGALHGLLDSLDSESAYLSPLEYKDYKEKSATKATGESGLVLIRRGYIGVLGSLPDTPAARAGLRVGDIIEKISGFGTGQMAIGQAELLLRGAPGTVVKLSVIRRGKRNLKTWISHWKGFRRRSSWKTSSRAISLISAFLRLTQVRPSKFAKSWFNFSIRA